MVKRLFVQILKQKAFQPLWKVLFHVSKIGMNYWGASVYNSGEIFALNYAEKKLSNEEHKIIFDVGANTGQFAFLALQHFRKERTVFSFEPSSFTFKILLEKIKQNSSDRFIRAFNIGLGSINETMKLYSEVDGATTSSLYTTDTSLGGAVIRGVEEVSIRKIDDFCVEKGIDRIDYLKLDVEGHELQALIGAKKMIGERSVKFIQFEFGKWHIDSRNYFRDYFHLLSDKYTIYRILPSGLWEIPEYNTDLEVFHSANFLAELKPFS